MPSKNPADSVSIYVPGGRQPALPVPIITRPITIKTAVSSNVACKPVNNRQPLLLSVAPKVGFVSLGCPKALVDSERIITELTRDGYRVASDYEGADLVVVNTCGFIESAVQESLDAIGEALNKNGKVIVTGCLGKDAEKIRDMHPAVLAVTGAHAYDEVITAVSKHAPMPQSDTR